jgi:uncharacterized lipoprotein YbaY
MRPEAIAIIRIASPQVPIAFALVYDDARVTNTRRGILRARITLNGTLGQALEGRLGLEGDPDWPGTVSPNGGSGFLFLIGGAL